MHFSKSKTATKDLLEIINARAGLMDKAFKRRTDFIHGIET